MLGTVERLRIRDGGGNQEQPAVGRAQAVLQVSPANAPPRLARLDDLTWEKVL